MKSYLYGPYSTSDIIKKAIIHETIGDLAVNRRTITRTYTQSSYRHQFRWSDIDVNDDALVDAGDDFGFNEKGLNSYEWPRRQTWKKCSTSVLKLFLVNQSNQNHQRSIGTTVRRITNIPGESCTVS